MIRKRQLRSWEEEEQEEEEIGPYIDKIHWKKWLKQNMDGVLLRSPHNEVMFIHGTTLDLDLLLRATLIIEPFDICFDLLQGEMIQLRIVKRSEQVVALSYQHRAQQKQKVDTVKQLPNSTPEHLCDVTSSFRQIDEMAETSKLLDGRTRFKYVLNPQILLSELTTYKSKLVQKDASMKLHVEKNKFILVVYAKYN